ncbi:unnamed protein product [Ceratitis capitata]|uniref:(Mediterranean fruit fly) hypothetical protein n=1 Tax=Ceratitis capitata TaxID=7213 RepID=A0A811VK25_CERCA|nr:unnamed protein product [Ceratitis capitata]
MERMLQQHNLNCCINGNDKSWLEKRHTLQTTTTTTISGRSATHFGYQQQQQQQQLYARMFSSRRQASGMRLAASAPVNYLAQHVVATHARTAVRGACACAVTELEPESHSSGSRSMDWPFNSIFGHLWAAIGDNNMLHCC